MKHFNPHTTGTINKHIGWKNRRTFRLLELLAALSTDPHPFENMVVIKRIEAAVAREIELGL